MIKRAIDYSTLDNVPLSSNGRPSALNNPLANIRGGVPTETYRIALQKMK